MGRMNCEEHIPAGPQISFDYFAYDHRHFLHTFIHQ